jgi:hypothetical protein
MPDRAAVESVIRRRYRRSLKPTPIEVDTIIMGAVRKKYPAILQSKGHRRYLFIRAALGGSGTIEIRVRVTVVALDGRIVLGEENNSPREKLKSLTDEGKKKIVLNMANIRCIASAGVDTLAAADITA